MTHLGGGDTSAFKFVVPSAVVARPFSSTFVASTALTKRPQRCLHAKTHRAG